MAKSDVQDIYDDKRKLEFLKQLAISTHVQASATLADVAVSTVYHWRNSDPQFRAEWLKALAAGYELLELEMLDRARNGSERKIFYHGSHIATVREYDDAMAFRLLHAHKEMVARTRAIQAERQIELGDVRARLDEKLEAMRRRMLDQDRLANWPSPADMGSGGAASQPDA